MRSEPRNYKWGELDGWVVESRHMLTGKDGVAREHITYWYGPDHGFGTTSGALESSAPVWPTRKAAEQALRKTFGSLTVAARRGYTPKRLEAITVPHRHLYACTTGRNSYTGTGRRKPIQHAAETGHAWKALCDVRIPGLPSGSFEPARPRTCKTCRDRWEARELEWERVEAQRVARRLAV